jgi:hypothetical protein
MRLHPVMPVVGLLLGGCAGQGPGAPDEPVAVEAAAVRLEAGGQVLTVDRMGRLVGSALEVPVGPLIVHLTFLDRAGYPLRLPDSSAVQPDLVSDDPALLRSDRTGPWQFHLHGRAGGSTTLRATLLPAAGSDTLLGPLGVPAIVVPAGGTD